MKKLWAVLILALLAASGPASAVIGTIDAVPAATLLLPYFEVDLVRPNGMNTLFSINNAEAGAVLAHVTIWTDQAIAAMSFDVYLTGYDTQTLSLRDILINGNVPVTAPAGQDPTNRISPRGPISQDVDLAACSSLPYQNPFLSLEMRAHLQGWLRGRESPLTARCAGSRQVDDSLLRGYVTIDTVSSCSSFFPSSWVSYGPLLTHQNVLWGDIFYVNPAQSFAHGETLVHIESCPTCFRPGDHTFYGRYNSASAADAREALPTTMMARYINGGVFNGGTSLLIWRETDEIGIPYPCNWPGPPAWYPLPLSQVAVFDEAEQPVVQATCPSFPCGNEIEIPNAAQRVKVLENLLVPFDSGWIDLNLQYENRLYQDPYSQMWAITTLDANGRFSVGFDAVQMDNANAPVVTYIPVP